MKTKLCLINSCVGGLMMGLVSVAVSSPARPEKLNVVLLYADDLGWQDLKCYDIDEHGFLVSCPQVDDMANVTKMKVKFSSYALDAKVGSRNSKK